LSYRFRSGVIGKGISFSFSKEKRRFERRFSSYGKALNLAVHSLLATQLSVPGSLALKITAAEWPALRFQIVVA
jgi:hypothetical protein